jgi:site-specific recombinase XerD
MDMRSENAANSWLMSYDDYLRNVVGAAATTRIRYVLVVRRFVRACCDGASGWESLSVQTITRFVRDEAFTKQGRGRSVPLTAVRSFLRFLACQGVVPRGLDCAIPRARLARQTKFQKSRLVPIHQTVAAALQQYLDRRRCHAAAGWSDRLFVNIHGDRLDVHLLGRWFTGLTREQGMTSTGAQDRAPTLTSFRHTFAVRRLREWHLAGLDVQLLLPTLATYLGHVGPESTYWYLSAVPELLRAAGARFQSDTMFRREP